MKLNYKDGSILLLRVILWHKDLTDSEKVMLANLLERDNYLQRDTEEFYCYEEWFAKNKGITTMTVRKFLKGLEKKGYIFIRKEKTERFVRNTYRINYEKLNKENHDFKFIDINEDSRKEEQPVQATETVVESNEIPQSINDIPEEEKVAEKAEINNINDKEENEMNVGNFNSMKKSLSPDRQMAMELIMAVGPEGEMRLKPKEIIAVESAGFFKTRGISGEKEEEIRKIARECFREERSKQPEQPELPVIDCEKSIEEGYIKMFLCDRYGRIYSKEKLERLLNGYFFANNAPNDIWRSTMVHMKKYLDSIEYVEVKEER